MVVSARLEEIVEGAHLDAYTFCTDAGPWKAIDASSRAIFISPCGNWVAKDEVIGEYEIDQCMAEYLLWPWLREQPFGHLFNPTAHGSRHAGTPPTTAATATRAAPPPPPPPQTTGVLPSHAWPLALTQRRGGTLVAAVPAAAAVGRENCARR